MSALILNIFYFLLLLRIVYSWFQKVFGKPGFINTILSKDTVLLLILLAIGLIPIWIFNEPFLLFPSAVGITEIEKLLISVGLSLLISVIWMMYIRKIDIYEKERWVNIIVIFIGGSIFSWFAILGYEILAAFGWNLNGNPINDFIYCVFAIGGIEEFVKIIPFLILLKRTNAINEPFDYILYPSIAALGFAFVENTMYIHQSNLYNIGGRALYATVAHMCFSSIVGYGMLLAKYRFKEKSRIAGFIIFFFFAMLTHGFYDFWLINEWVSQFSFLTTLFFLITIHIWFILKNNAVNVSNFYNEHETINNDQLKWYLVISLSSLLMLGYMIVTWAYGLEKGWQYLASSWLAYGYMVLYLTLSFSRYRIQRGYWTRFHIPKDFYIPKPIKRDDRAEI